MAAGNWRRGDEKVVELLAADGFEGDRFDRNFRLLYLRLAPPASATLQKWVNSGAIFEKCYREGRPVPPEYKEQLPQQESMGVLDDVLQAGSMLFLRAGLRGGGWRSDGGRSLQTYFISSCVREFKEIHVKAVREWRTRQAQSAWPLGSPEENEDDLALIRDQASGPEAFVVEKLELERQLERFIDPVLRAVMRGRAYGLTEAEAAKTVGISASTAQSKLRRWRMLNPRPASKNGDHGKEIC